MFPSRFPPHVLTDVFMWAAILIAVPLILYLWIFHPRPSDTPACQTCWLGSERVGHTTTGRCFPPAYADDPPGCDGPDKTLAGEVRGWWNTPPFTPPVHAPEHPRGGLPPDPVDVEDAEPPSTTLQVCEGGLPSLSLLGSAQDGCHSVDVSATSVASADQILYASQSFSHVYRQGGDPACIFTAQRGDHPGEIVAGTATGGRDCRPEDTQCAYIAEGYYTFAVTGQSCQEAGVPECGGPLCV